MESLLIEKLPNSGLDYEEYFEQFKIKSELDDFSAYPVEEHEHLQLAKLNFQRSSRIHKTFKPLEEIKLVLAKIIQQQTWMIISEDWCGDSAQNIPYMIELAKLNSKINVKIIQRDKHPEIIDLYLTNGTRSIPKLVAFDVDRNELFQWGPRPKAAAELVANLKAEGKSKTEFLEQLHLWYGRNRGSEIQKELLELIVNSTVNDRN